MSDGGSRGRGRPGDGAREEPAVRRPGFVVLGAEALPPATNVVRPVPQPLTHELVVDQPFTLDRPGGDRGPDGVLPAGTRVAVLHAGDDRCRAVTSSGLAVDVPRAALRELPPGA
ncbi:hypothetical protein ACWKWC_01390 [Geodermatophilus nigrescens]|uniref:hypothetical protein n=1 Tax=Geodermatophilus sp. FMUSA9-8 TaxID=3120155 RepID=UPI003009FFCD